jgi:hypothetical protein
MIYCVWYPSGGFGHFINAVLTLHGKNFVRPNNFLEFSKNGNSHNLDLVVPKYLHNQWSNNINFIDDKNYCVLIDNGINDESENFKSKFPNSTIIKVCYSDYSWPVVAKTMIVKAMNSSIEDQLPVNSWASTESWVYREKYFLFLQNHALRQAWKSTDNNALYIDHLFDYYCFFDKLNSFAEVESFTSMWVDWRNANIEYIAPIEIAKDIINSVKLKKRCKLDHITDIWIQAVVYYYIWVTFKKEVPHNDFANFFVNTDQIIDLVA